VTVATETGLRSIRGFRIDRGYWTSIQDFVNEACSG
jgi:hypothetical protein